MNLVRLFVLSVPTGKRTGSILLRNAKAAQESRRGQPTAPADAVSSVSGLRAAEPAAEPNASLPSRPGAGTAIAMALIDTLDQSSIQEPQERMPSRNKANAVRSIPSLRVGVSSCLLGQPVRWDGRDKRHSLIAGLFAQHMDLVAVCPEVAIGLGVPRPPIMLVRRQGGVHAVTDSPERTDHSTPLVRLAGLVAREHPGLNGYIFKSKSPSCGLGSTPIHGARGQATATGTGLFAQELLRRRPDLPVIEEEDLVHPARRGAFLDQVVAHARWKQQPPGRRNAAALRDFHDAHRLALLARGGKAFAKMNTLLVEALTPPSEEGARAYIAGLIEALARPPSWSALKRALAPLLQELHACLDARRRSTLKRLLAAPSRNLQVCSNLLIFLWNHVGECDHPGWRRQTLLCPHPVQLAPWARGGN